MSVDLEELLRDAYEADVTPSHDPEEAWRRGRVLWRRRRAVRGVTAAGSAVAIVLVAVLAIGPLLEPEVPDILDDAAPTETDPDAPSQSASDAERDGVLPEIASLPFDVRINLVEATLQTTRIDADEGVWVISRTGPEAEEYLGGHLVSDTDGESAYEAVSLQDYTEVLLLDSTESAILRAFPLAPYPSADTLAMDDDAVYCGRGGDGGEPDSMLCRIDRATYEWHVRIFPKSAASAFGQPDVITPDHWSFEQSADPVPQFSEIVVAGGFVVGGQADQLHLADAGSLELVDPATLDASREIGSIAEVDADARELVVAPAEYLTGEDADRAHEEETGEHTGAPTGYMIRNLDDEPIRYPVAEDVRVRLMSLWGGADVPVAFEQPMSWSAFAHLWTDEALDELPDRDVNQVRDSHYWVTVVESEVVRLDAHSEP